MIMKRLLNYLITPADAGQTIRSFLLCRGYSKSVLIHLKKTDYGILRNGVWAYVNDILSAGDTLTVTLLEPASDGILPRRLPLSVVYEDEDILIVDKPADMPVHPSLNNYENTLANAVMYYFNEQDIPYTFRCINRLDRDTTGLTILAKNMLSGAILSRQMVLRQIHRTYLAIVKGLTPPSGTIDAPIARKAESLIERTVDFASGEPAVTHFTRLDHRNGLSLLALRLETGRTHQIRVHMKHIGFPLIGDFLYYPDFSQIKRQALHSYRLDFTHPVTNEACSFSAPLPDDMRQLFPGDIIL